MHDDVVSLWRPIGPKELKLTQDADMRAFPRRLPAQPFFYPVLTEAYATQIARDWNAARGGGYVTHFQVRKSFLANYSVQQAGGRDIQEYWIPADDLPSLDAAIVGRIEVTAEFPSTKPEP